MCVYVHIHMYLYVYDGFCMRSAVCNCTPASLRGAAAVVLYPATLDGIVSRPVARTGQKRRRETARRAKVCNREYIEARRMGGRARGNDTYTHIQI